jgi:hypothetical protein
MLDMMVFSRNRALQLYALLESIEKYFDATKINVTILHRYDDDHKASLANVSSHFGSYKFIDESDFQNQVQEFLASPGELVTFLTDDIIFKDHVSTQQVSEIMLANPSVLAFSLRLGLHVYDCYALGQEQPSPQGNVYPPNLFVWNWRSAQMDWEYAFSVDGHVFRKPHLSTWTSPLNYHHPNSFEEALQLCRRLQDIPPAMACYVTSKLVNLPINRVQDSHQNRCGEIDSNYLLEKWDAGLCLDIERYHRVLNKGVHDELELFFKER